MTNIGEPFDATVYRLETPDGTMFITIGTEDSSHIPNYIEMSIGKTGGAAQAWATATARLVEKLLPHVGIGGVIEAVSGITTDKIRSTSDGTLVRSGPEALSIALLKYVEERRNGKQ